MAVETKRESRVDCAELGSALEGGAACSMEPGSASWHEAVENAAIRWHEAEVLMPHRLPARMVDFVALCGKFGALGRTRVGEHWPCLEPAPGAEGALRLPPEACVELIAQTYAGIAGLRAGEARGRGDAAAPGIGFLVGLRDFSFSGEGICVGDELLIRLEHEADIDAVSLIRGEVYKNRQSMASGQVKIYVPPGSPENIA